MSKNVFISRRLDETSPLKQALISRGFDVIAKSLIKIKNVPFDRNIPLTDWIFFSSSKAVQYFFSRKPKLKTQKFAALGNATAAELRKFREPEFVGQSMNVKETAEAFAVLTENKSVLFPGAEDSLRTIQRSLREDQVLNVICYRTIEDPYPIGSPDVLVFSSPSNVRAFFKVNNVLDHQRVIAFGDSTRRSLINHGVRQVTIPASLENEDLLKAIIEVTSS